MRGYLVAIGAVAVMGFIRSIVFKDFGSHAPFVAFFPAVIVAALYGGLGPGLLATVLGAVYATWFFLLPNKGSSGLGLPDETALAIYLVSSVVMVLICVSKTKIEAQARATARDALAKARALASLERKHHEVLDEIADLLCTVDKEWRYTYMNRKAEEVLQTRFADVAGKRIWDAFKSVVGTVFEEQCRLVERDGHPREFEYLSATANRWMAVRIYPSEDGYALYGTDVTARKLAAQEVEEKENQLRLVTESAPALIAYIDRDERYVFVNKAYEKWFSCRTEDIIGKTMSDMLGASYERLAPHIRRALAGESPVFETETVDARGSSRRVQVSYAPDRQANGEVRGFVGVVTDVTDLRIADASLRATERLAAKRLAELDTLYRMAPAGLCFIDRELKYVRINEALARLNGRSVEAHLGCTVREVLGDAADAVEPILLQTIKTGQPVRNQSITIPDENGDLRHYIATFQPLFDNRRELLGLSAVVQDITSIRESEQALALSEERYRTVVESAAEGIWTTDGEGIITFANQAMASMLGYEPAELLGRQALDFVFEDDVTQSLNRRKAQRPGVPMEVDVRFKRADGSVMWARCRTQADFDENGNRIRAMALVTDITEQRRLEERQRTLVDASDVFASSLDYQSTLKRLAEFTVPGLADWCAVHVREGDVVTQVAVAHSDPERVRWAAELQERYPPDLSARTGVGEVLRTGRPELYSEIPQALLDAAAVDDEHRRIIAEVGFTSAMIVPLVTRGRTIGTMTLVMAESKRRYDEDDLAFAEQLALRAALAVDNARLFTAAQTEITERIEAEREIRRLNAELEERVDERTKELRLALTDLEGFCYTVSHDLRAPMRSISGNSMIILEEFGPTLDDAGREILRRLSAAATKMGTLIDDLLQFSRLGREELTRKPIDLSYIAHAVVEEMHDLDPNRVCVHIEQGLEAEADPIMARLVLQNLMENAVKYSSKAASARIEVGQTVHGGHPVFFVKDNGIGFEMDYVDKIFQPFERLHRESEFPGTGIGLANVRRIVLRHGGRVWAESEPGKGATFYFTLSSDRDADAHLSATAPSFLA